MRVYNAALPPTVFNATDKVVLYTLGIVSRPHYIRRVWLSTTDTTGTVTPVEVRWQRITADGTATTVTARPIMPNDGAAVTLVKSFASANPTLDAAGIVREDMWNIQLPYEVVLGDDEIIEVAGVANAGLAIRIVSAINITVSGGITFIER